MTTSHTISRKQFLRGGAAAALTTAALPSGASARHRGDQPNIVFILADDLGYADLSSFGQTDYETPNLDLAADPRERANLSSKEPQLFADLKARWSTWNSGMLPITADVGTHTIQPSWQADRYGGAAAP